MIILESSNDSSSCSGASILAALPGNPLADEDVSNSVGMTFELWQAQARVASILQGGVLQAIRGTIVESFKNAYGAYTTTTATPKATSGGDGATAVELLWKRRLRQAVAGEPRSLEVIDPVTHVSHANNLRRLVLDILFRPSIWVIVMQQQREQRSLQSYAGQFGGWAPRRGQLIQAEHCMKLVEIEDQLRRHNIAPSTDAAADMNRNMLYCISFLTKLNFAGRDTLLDGIWHEHSDWLDTLFTPQKPLSEDDAMVRSLVAPEEIILAHGSDEREERLRRKAGFQLLGGAFEDLKSGLRRALSFTKKEQQQQQQQQSFRNCWSKPRRSVVIIAGRTDSLGGDSLRFPQIKKNPFSRTNSGRECSMIHFSSQICPSQWKVPFDLRDLRNLRSLYVEWSTRIKRSCPRGHETLGQDHGVLASDVPRVLRLKSRVPHSTRHFPSPLPLELYIRKRN